MNDKILVKTFNTDINKELTNINFSKEYIDIAKSKLDFLKLKIFNLKPAEANILKQTCLSLGFDAAVNRDAVTCKCDKSDALLSGSINQIEILCQKLEKQPFRLKNLAKQIRDIIFKSDCFYIKDITFSYDESHLMGIINVTPDSFSDGGINFDINSAFDSAIQMYQNGASIIDIGGESTRPDASSVDWHTECERIIPVIQKIKKFNSNIILSVDTIHPETCIKAIENGADILNTVDCIEKFESIYDFLITNKIPVVITHSKGIPPVNEEKDFDGDIVDEIFKFFADKIQYLKSRGLVDNLFILDVGIGFGKSLNDQFELIKRADEFSSLGYPVLFGISRKSFISKTFDIENRDEITRVYSQHLISKKVNILRVHDVKKHVDLKKYLSKLH